MFATTHIRSGARRRTFMSLVGLALAGLLLSVSVPVSSSIEDEDLEGRAPTPEELRPSVEAAFPRESYAPNSTASLVLFNSARAVTLQVFRSGPERTHTVGYSEMQGVAVTKPAAIGAVRKSRAVRVRIANWPSGLYFARLHAGDGRVGFAPFIVRPHRLGEHRVAVVLPTMTWQAYNLRDDDGDGKGDTWYARWKVRSARLGRPFLNRGVPYNFRRYDLPFLNWLSWTDKQVDVLSDSDLGAATSGKALADAYDLVVFPGHHEYVTTREYDLAERYRDLGGNLAFLSANNFFWRIVKHGDAIEKTEQWRDLGRPEAALIGAQYRGNDDGQHRAPWIVRDAAHARWLFTGTGLKHGSAFGTGGIEIDETTRDAPAGVHVIAEIPNLLGPGFTAQMTYYETAAGAKVFAAGAFTVAGEVTRDPIVAKLMENLWTQVARP